MKDETKYKELLKIISAAEDVNVTNTVRIIGWEMLNTRQWQHLLLTLKTIILTSRKKHTIVSHIFWDTL